jgi:hypothetical protein
LIFVKAILTDQLPAVLIQGNFANFREQPISPPDERIQKTFNMQIRILWSVRAVRNGRVWDCEHFNNENVRSASMMLLYTL